MNDQPSAIHLNRTTSLVLLVCILLLGAGLRFREMTRDVRFHSDEALYTTYARSAAVHGDWMLPGPLDKPPLSLYASALALHFFAAEVLSSGVIDVPIRRGEFAAKAPNVLAGLVFISTMYTLAQTLYGDIAPALRRRTALLAALMVAVSPYAVAYSASAFTDMLMLMFMTGAVLAGARRRPAWSGSLLALSIASKPQGILFLPLAAGALLLCDDSPLAKRVRGVTRILIALFAGLTLLLLWDMARPETSLFTLGSINISQGRMISSPHEWPARFSDWAGHGAHLMGTTALTIFILLVGCIGAIQRRDKTDILLLGMAGGYFALHWLGAFYTFDRYLLPLVPLLALMAARALAAISQMTYIVGLCALIIVLGASGYHDPRADVYRSTQSDGLIHLADYLNSHSLGAIIYDRWMGWEMGYYMGAWSNKRRVYYPDPVIQAQDALLNPDAAPRYFVAPDNQDVSPWLDAFHAAGFRSRLDYDAGGFRVYEIIPPWTNSEGASGAGSS